MRRFYKFLLPVVAIVAMALTPAAQAQDTLTVANGTSTNDYIPVYGLYVDEAPHSQMVFPASMLGDMTGGLISQLTWYLSSTASSAWGTTATIKMMEVSDSTISSFQSTANATTVWSGTMNATSSPVDILLTVPYVYQGGNLLIDVSTTVADYSSCSWSGLNRNGASVYQYGTNAASTRNFLPKTTFIYTIGGSFCFPPMNLTATTIGSDVDITWTDTNSSSWQIAWGTGAINPDTATVNVDYATSTTYTFYNLADGLYNVYVRSDCGDDYSVWREVSFMIGGCSIRIEGEDSYGDGWNNGSLAVVQGGTTVQTVGMTSGNSMSANVLVSSALPVNFVWSSGNYDDEVTIRIYDGSNTMVYSVNEPNSGTIYTMQQPCPTCMPVQNLSAATTGTDADITWVDNSASSWEVVWGNGVFDPDTVTSNTTVVSSTTYSMYSLTDGSYTVYVRALCDDGDTSTWTSTSFMIGGCMIKIVGEDGYADGWNGGYLTVLQGGHTVAVFDAANAANNGIGPMLDSVMVGVTSAGPVSFTWSSGSYDDEVTIWIYHHSGTLLYTVNNPTVGTLFTIGDACNGCFAPNSVHVDSLTQDAAHLVWNGSADSYGIEWYEIGGSTNTATTTDNDYTLTGLTAGTGYVFRVWSDCNGSTSDTVVVNFTTLGNPVATFPYTTGFEDGQDIAWSFINDITNKWYIDSAVGCNSSKSLYISNTNGNNNNYNTSGIQFSYAYRSMQISDSGQYSVAFNWKANGESNYDYLRAWIAPMSAIANLSAGQTPDGQTSAYNYTTVTPAGWIDLGGKMNLVNTWQQAFATPSLGAGNYAIIFMWANDVSGGSQPAVAVDNIDIRALSCPTPSNLQAVIVRADTIALAWTAGDSETSWLVTCGTDTVVTTDTTYTFAGLTPSTNYAVTVRAICGADDTSFSIGMDIHTPCSATTLPYSENFDNVTTSTTSATGVRPNCWDYIMTGTATYQTNTYLPQVYYSTSYSNSGSYCLRLYGVGYHMLPPMPTSLDSLEMTLSAYITSSSYGLEIGVMEGATFVPVQTATLTTSVHTDLEVSFASYTGNSRIIAFRNYYTSSTTTYYSYVYLDDIEVYYAPTCPRVLDIFATDLQTTSATVNWTDTSSNATWYVEYDTVDFVPGTNHMTPIMVTDTFYVLTGLDSGMVYHVYVYPDCNGDINARHATFTTLASAPASVPFSCDFEAAGVNGWDFVQAGQNNYWVVGAATNNGGSQSMYITNDGTANNYSGNASYSFAIRTINLTAGDYTCSYDWKANGESSFDFLRVALVPASVEFTAGDYCGFNNTSDVPTGGIALDGAYRLNLQNSWQTRTEEITITTPGTYKLVFMWRNDGSIYNNPPAAFDNVMLFANTCPVVQNLVATANGSSNATVDWTDVATSASAWEVRYAAAGTTNYTTITASTHPVLISGLTAMTSYSVQVRPICSATDTGMWSPATLFSTAMCDGALMATNFDTAAAATTDSYSPIGFSCYNYSYTQIIIDSARMAAFAGNEITAFGFLPVGSAAGYGTYFTNMDVYMANVSESQFASDNFIVPDNTSHIFQQVITNGDFTFTADDWNYIAFDTPFTWDGHSNVLFAVNRGHGSYSCSADFSAHTGTEYKMLCDYNDDYPYNVANPTPDYTERSTTVGDIVFVGCGGCAAPVVSSVTHDYGSATIVVSGSGNSYELEYGTSLAVLGNTMTSTTGTFSISGLTPATTYYFHVRQECDDNEVSSWTEGFFTTDSLPCMEVTGLAVTGTSYNSVSVSWTAGGNEHAWEIKAYSTVDSVSVTSQTTSATVSGLVPQRAYSVTVRPLCGNGTVEGPWCAPVQFTTDACQPVSNVTVSNVTGTSATVAWTAPAGATNFRVAFGYQGFSQGEELGIYNTSSNPYMLTDLEPTTAYTVQVATVCTENLVSAYVGADFTTTDGQQGIDGADMADAISLYPNPASTMVTLRVGEQMVGSTVSIVDVNGRVVMSETLASETLTIDLNDVAKGAYFVRLTGEQATVVRKLIVK